MISEREKLEFESLPEFVREPRPSREVYNSKPQVSDDVEAALPKSAELEALWPGVNHEFLHAPRKGASFYLTIGFMVGAVVSLIGVWGISIVTHFASSPHSTNKEIIVDKGQPATTSGAVSGGAAVATSGDPEVIFPASPTIEVGPGDTLAAIALRNYHRATPRLLDEICRANNMRNANVLSLGQKLALPEYRPQSRQVATGGNSVQQ